MTAKFGGGFIRPQHLRHRVPAGIGADAPFECRIARALDLLGPMDGVHIGCIGGKGQFGTAFMGAVKCPAEQSNSGVGAFKLNDAID